MITKEEIGRRIKKVREQMHMTLKNVEAKANISATHISEIERGKTSPTIGALLRIADALEKDPAYFIEADELDDVSFVALEDRQKKPLNRAEGVAEMLTYSIPSGKINAQLITLVPTNNTTIDIHEHDCDESALILKGNLIFTVNNDRYELAEGDSIYFLASQPHGYINASTENEAQMIWFASERGVE